MMKLKAAEKIIVAAGAGCQVEADSSDGHERRHNACTAEVEVVLVVIYIYIRRISFCL